MVLFTCLLYICLVTPDEAVGARVDLVSPAEHPRGDGGTGLLPQRDGGRAEGRASRWGNGAQATPQYHPGAQGKCPRLVKAAQ